MGIHNKERNFRLQPIVLAVHLALAGAAMADPSTNALPTGGQVVSGQATIQQQGGNMDIQQGTPRAALDWQTFNIGAQAQVNFHQPDANSVALNRVAVGNASVIEGKLTANGQVFLVNPSGVLFGKGAQVDVGGLVATTMNISNKDFAAGNDRFSRDGSVGEVVNQGVIKARDGGYVALVAATVLNEGTLQANGGGTVALAAGDGATLQFNGGNLVNIQVDPATVKTLIENKQLIQAEGGRVLMTAVAASQLQGAVINNSGSVDASSITSDGGVIRLTGADEITNIGTLDASGKTAGGTVEISAAGIAGTDSSAQHPSLVRQAGIVKADALSGKGGKIVLTGGHLQLDKDSLTTATGTSGGGEIYAGGGKHGSPLPLAGEGPGVRVQNAKSTRVEKGAVLDASATDNGNGGTIVAWGDDAARAYGTFKAKGGLNGGNGGWVETSGHWLNVDGIKVDTKAPQGKSGEWLLDPWDVEITGSNSNTVSGNSGGTTTWTPSGAGSPAQILNTDIQTALLSNHVTIETTAIPPSGTENGDITVSSPITWSTDKILTLQADRNINVNATLNATGNAAGLTLSYGAAAGNGYFLNNGAKITLSGDNPVLKIGKSGGLVSYTVINHLGVEADATTPPLLHSLQGIKTNLTGNYALGSDINASATSGWNDVAGVKQGFTPIGSGTTSATAFTGNFEGLGHTIDRLFINRPSTDNVGLFGTVGLDSGTPNSISHVGLTNADVTGGSDVGILAGQTLPVTSVAHTFSGGKVSGNSFGIGGLIGYNQAGKNGDVSSSLTNSFSTAAVTGVSGTFAVGGLVGWNFGSVTQTYSHGAVQGDAWVGGLIGALTGRTVSSSYSTGSVSGTTSVGGLVGYVDSGANIYSSYSMGAVTGTTGAVGGLVGTLSAGGNGFIHDSYSTGAVSGPTGLTGGLVGEVSPGSAISFSYWDTDTSGTTKGIGSGTPSGTSTLTGLSHAEMMNAASFPSTWSAVGWTLPVGVGIYYPYLTWRFQTPPQVVSGSLTGAAGGETIKAAQQGQLLDYFPATYRDQPQASTGFNGFYYMALNANAIASGNALLAYLSATPGSTGAVRQSDGLNLLSLNLTPNILSVTSAANVIGSAQLVTARGETPTTGPDPLADAPYTVSGANITVNNNVSFQTSGLTNFNLGGSITTNNTSQTYNSAITLTDNATLSSGSGRISFGQSGSGASVAGAFSLGLNTTGNFTQVGASPNAPGALHVSGLELLGNGTAYTLTNPANEIGILAGNTGSVNLVNNAALTVGSVNASSDPPSHLATNGLTTTGTSTLQTTGANDITLALTTGQIISNAAGDAVVLASGRDFINNFGATAIRLTNAGSKRFLVYSTDPTNPGQKINGLNYQFKQYNAPYGGTTPPAETVDNSGFLYTRAPALTPTLINVFRDYNGTTTAILKPENFTATGMIDGDTVSSWSVIPLPATGTYANKNVATGIGISGASPGTATVTNIVNVPGTTVRVYGYGRNTDDMKGDIGKLAVTLSASAASKTYNGLTDIVGAVPAVSADTLATGDTLQASGFSFAYDNKNVGTANKTVYSGLGTVTIKDASNADMTGNYAISTNGTGIYLNDVVNTASTIAQASLTLTANNQSKVFGKTFTFTGQEFTPAGLQNNETIGTVTLASTGAPASADVGNYPINITPGSASGGTFTPSNYTIAYLPGNMTVSTTSLVLNLTATDQIKTYGAEFIFTGTEFTQVGLANGDTIDTVQLTSAGAPALANVGNFPIIITPGSAVGSFNPNNYTITYFNGTLTIDPANLTVTANGQVKTYDGLSHSGGNGVVYSGFVLGENSSVLNGTLTYSGTSQGARNVGSYLITPGGQTATNYTIGYVSGTLGITPATLYLSALPDSKIYDGNTSSSKTPVYLGLFPGDSLSRLSQSFNSKEAGDRLLNVDSGYTINDANAGNNYRVDSQFARGVIIPPPPPVFGSFIAQEIEPKLGPRYVANPPGNGIVSGEAVADVGGEEAGADIRG
ncbi:MAG: MBG domain-containing protein, partial [Candidatus Methylumidiphilus sp.]